MVPEETMYDLIEIDILVAIYILCVVIGNEGTRHSPNFQLKSILDKSSSDQVKIFPLKTLVKPFSAINRVILIKVPILDIVANGTASPGLDLEHIRVTILVNISAIDLRSQKEVFIDNAISVVIFIESDNLD